MIFVDDYSKFTWICLLKHRSDLVSIFQTFHKMIQTQFSHTIKVFRLDNAQEYHLDLLGFVDDYLLMINSNLIC